MEYNDLLNELFDLLDENSDIKNIKSLKKKLLADKDLQDELNLYKKLMTVHEKKKLFQNIDYVQYLKSENNIRLLIVEIKQKFNCFNNRKCQHESH